MAPEAAHLSTASQRPTTFTGQIERAAVAKGATAASQASWSTTWSSVSIAGGGASCDTPAVEDEDGDQHPYGKGEHQNRRLNDADDGRVAAASTAAAVAEQPTTTTKHLGGGKRTGVEEGGGSGGGLVGRSDRRFSSQTSFGSVTQDRPSSVRVSTWSESRGSRWCCSCVPLSRRGDNVGANGSAAVGQAGAPETFNGEDGGGGDRGGASSSESGGVGGWGRGASGFTGKSGFRPRHRRGHSAGYIAPGEKRSTRTARTAQPQGWETHGGGGGGGSAATSTVSSSAGTLANASGGSDEGREAVLSWRRMSGSWGSGGVAAADREFNRILKAGLDVFKHSSMPESVHQWVDVVPKRIREFLSRTCPLEDENQGLVTLFLDKERENLCWCPPGAAELVPDERYRLSLRSLVEVIPGDKAHLRMLSLRSSARPNPLVFELDSDDLYDILSKGIVRILERNHLRDTLLADPTSISAI